MSTNFLADSSLLGIGVSDATGRPDNNSVGTIGVGFGPSNIALAVAYAESGNSNTLQFLEATSGPDWQPGMLIPGSDIQHNPLRDFITPKNPCSKYGYLCYLKSQDRLWSFVNLDAPFPPRSDYARYVRWVAEQFAHQVLYSEIVTRITVPFNGSRAARSLVQVDTASGKSFKARSLCFGPGRSNHIPPIFAPFVGENVLHFTNYLRICAKWRAHPHTRPRSVAIIGSSQSAVEILLDMKATLPEVTLHSVFRNFSYVLKDTSPFTEDLVTPEFTDYFYNASPQSKHELTNQLLRSNYGSVDHDILRKLYFLLYENQVNEDKSLVVHNNSLVTDIRREGRGMLLGLKDAHTGTTETHFVDAVILATGFRNSGRQPNEELMHPLLKDIAPFYKKQEDGTLNVTRDYQLVPLDQYPEAPPIVLNGLCESTHGLGDAGSFSLLSYRAYEIEQGLKRELGVGVKA